MARGQDLLIDGSRGEGGGQILRTSLALATITGRPLRITRIRAGRARPGLAAQHLTCVRALAEICNADLTGAELGSMELGFSPRRAAHAGRYGFNVALARAGGSAGAASLILQSVLLPLTLAGGKSDVTLLGGTHVPWSPSFDFLEQTFLPLLADLGLIASLELRRPGFYPVGGGRMLAHIASTQALSPLKLEHPGALSGVHGRITLAGLSFEIASRMRAEAVRLLSPLGVSVEIEIVETEARSPGIAIFLTPDEVRGRSGFSAIGERGRPAEAVAKEACEALLEHLQSGAAVDLRLADQLLLPLAFASGKSTFTTSRASGHLRTNAHIIEQFGLAHISIQGEQPARVTVCPK